LSSTSSPAALAALIVAPALADEKIVTGLRLDRKGVV